MRKATKGIFAGAVIVIAAMSWGGARAADVPSRLNQPVTGKIDQQLFDEAVLIYSNAVRKANGRPPLRLDPALSQAAADHARNMARLRTHSHELPVRGQKHLKQRMQRVSVDYRLAAENIAMDKVYRLLGRPIAMGYSGCNFTYGDTKTQVPIHTYASLAKQVVDRWYKSPGHKKNLLNPKFRRIGSGVGIDPNGAACGDFYLAQNFAD
jgi:uncharacterized protein YkwD